MMAKQYTIEKLREWVEIMRVHVDDTGRQDMSFMMNVDAHEHTKNRLLYWQRRLAKAEMAAKGGG